MNIYRKIITVLAIATLIFSLSIAGCNSGKKQTTITRFLMDTKVDLTFYGISEKKAKLVAEEVFAEMERLENLLSRHIPTSDISRVNRAAGREWVVVEPETIFLVQKALEIAEKSGGAFDPTVGALLRLWGFGTADPRVPSSIELEQALKLVDYRKIKIDKEKNMVFLPEEGMELDLGGIAKGFIVDRGQQVLERFSLDASLINAGGDISISGDRPSGGKWRIAIQDPGNPQEWIAILHIWGGCVATSGDYQRYFEENGVLYHHILDPGTGFPAAGLSSVTVVAPSTALADALSTAVFVMGREKGLELLEKIPDVEGLVVDEEGNIFLTSGLEDDTEILK